MNNFSISTQLVPCISVVAICLAALLTVKRNFQTPNDHCCSSETETSIFFGNICSSFSVWNVGVLYFYAFNKWGTPSFLTVLLAIVVAHVFYIVLAYKKVNSSSFLSIFSKSCDLRIFWGIFLLCCFVTILVEFAFLRLYLKAIFNYFSFSNDLSTLIVLIAGLFCFAYVFFGGIRSTLRTDTVIVCAAAGFLLYAICTDGFDFSKQLIALKHEYKIGLTGYDLSFLSVLNYLSAGLCVAALYVMIPDYWHRNLTLPAASSPKRCFTIFISMIAHIMIAILAYAFASSMPVDPLTRVLNTAKPPLGLEDINNAINIASGIGTGSQEMSFFFISFFVLSFTITTVDSIIISIANILNKEKISFLSDDGTYLSNLGTLYQLCFLFLLISCIVSFEWSIRIGLVSSAILLLLFFVFILSRLFKFRAELSPLKIILHSIVIMATILIGNYLLTDEHLYYSLAAIISTFISYFLVFLRHSSKKAGL